MKTTASALASLQRLLGGLEFAGQSLDFGGVLGCSLRLSIEPVPQIYRDVLRNAFAALKIC